MMGERRAEQAALFYEFSLERHVPADHLLRAIDRFVDLASIREQLKPHYSHTGRPSIDPELLIRMLIIGYTHGIRSERRLCEEVHLNLAYRWFCRLGLESDVPDHSTFSKNRHGRFRDSDLLRTLFETSVVRCMAEGLVGGESFAVDSSLIRADANRQRSDLGTGTMPTQVARRAVSEYIAVLDDAAFGAATPVLPKHLYPVDPAARYTAAHGGAGEYCYATNYLIDTDHAVIMDVETTTVIRQAEVLAAKRMLDRTHAHFGVHPEKLIADTGYGSAEMLGWLVEERGIAPHIPVFDKSTRTDGTFLRVDFVFDPISDCYTCPAGNFLKHYRRTFHPPRTGVDDEGYKRYRASKVDATAAHSNKYAHQKNPPEKFCALSTSPRYRQNRSMDHLKAIEKEGGDVVRPPQTHSQAGQTSIARTKGGQRRIPPRSYRPKPPQTGQADPGTSCSNGILKPETFAIAPISLQSVPNC
jgi:transposase